MQKPGFGDSDVAWRWEDTSQHFVAACRLLAGTVSGDRRGKNLLFARLFVGSVLPFAAAVLLQLEAVGASSFFLNAVIAFAAGGAFEPNVFPHLKSSCPGPWTCDFMQAAKKRKAPEPHEAGGSWLGDDPVPGWTPSRRFPYQL
jgi:hypothetical protein